MALRGLDHALVLTDDIETTRAFYCDALGLEVGERPPLPFPGYWLYLGGTACLHVADRRAYEARAATVGLRPTGACVDHVAFTAEADDELTARLEAAGVETTVNETPAAGRRQIFLSDPNGVRIELHVR